MRYAPEHEDQAPGHECGGSAAWIGSHRDEKGTGWVAGPFCSLRPRETRKRGMPTYGLIGCFHQGVQRDRSKRVEPALESSCASPTSRR